MWLSNYLVLALFSLTRVRAQDTCKTDNDVTVFIASSRNQTGDLITEVTQDQEGSGEELPSVEVEARTSTCPGSRSKYHVKVTITLPAGPPALPPPTPPATPPTPPPSTTPSILSPPPPPLPGYSRLPGLGCYRYHTAASSWLDAKHACELEGGHLIVLNSQTEADAMLRMIEQNEQRVTGTMFRDYAWVGLRESNITQNEFYTIFDEPLNATGFAHWHPKHPYYTGTLGDYVALYADAEGGLADVLHTWNYRFAYACEQGRC